LAGEGDYWSVSRLDRFTFSEAAPSNHWTGGQVEPQFSSRPFGEEKHPLLGGNQTMIPWVFIS